MEELTPFDVRSFGKPKHRRTLHQNICIPSTAQSYSLCIEYMKRWFLSLFEKNPFQSIYVDGKNIFDDYRRLSHVELLKRKKPALAIVPSFDWSFDNEHVDMYQFGTKLYQARGLYQNAFYKDSEHNSYLGIAMETIFMEFTFRIRVETRAQQLDMFKYIQLAGRIGNTVGQDVSLDFHVPYDIMIAMAEDAGFEIIPADLNSAISYPRVKNIQAFLAHLNTHSQLPFLYKMRTINGRNEFFIRMDRMYVHVRPTNLTGDDGEREAVMSNNFALEMTAEVRFPAPKFYAYYTDHARDFTTVYSAWKQPNGIVSAFYTFKGIDVPEKNKLGWDKYLETSYEDDPENINKPLSIDLSELFNERELGETIRSCIKQGISPSIFVDVFAINGGEHPAGRMNWDTMTYTTESPVRSNNTYLAIYVDMMYINNYIAQNRDYKDDRLSHSQDPASQYKDNPQKI